MKIHLFNFALLPIMLFSLNTFALGPGYTDKVVRIGVMAPLSGAAAEDGQQVVHGIQAFIKRFNASGGVHGRKLELFTGDNQYEALAAKNVYEQLTKKDDVFGFVCTYGSQPNLAVLPAVEKEGIPTVGPIAGADLASPIRKPVFVIRPNGRMEGEFLINHVLKDFGAKSVAIYYQDDGLGKSLLEGAKSAFDKANLKWTVAGSYSRNADNLGAVADTILSKNPDVVFLAGSMPATASFVKKAALNHKKIIYLGPQATTSEPLARELAPLGARYYGSSVVPSLVDKKSELITNYLADMKAAGFTDIDLHGVEGYLAIAVFAEGLKKVGPTLSRDAFIAAMEELNSTILGVKINYSPQNHQGMVTPYLVEMIGHQFLPVTAMKP